MTQSAGRSLKPVSYTHLYVLVYSPIVIMGAILAPAILGKGFAQPDNIVAVLSTQYLSLIHILNATLPEVRIAALQELNRRGMLDGIRCV